MSLLAGIALACAGFPLLLALANLSLFRTPPRYSGRPFVSVLVPARNEERNIGACVAHVLANEQVDLELIVLDDHSTDGTRDILDEFEDARLVVADAPPLPSGWCGKQHACMTLASLARHDLMVYIDADVRLAPDALNRIAGFMATHDLGLASGFPRQITRTWSEWLVLPLIHLLLLGYLPMLAMRVSAAPSLGAGCGQLMAAQRDAYRRAGGHAAIRTSLHDGLTLPRAFRRAGSMTGLFDASGIAECRMYAGVGELLEGLGKNATEGMATPTALPVWTALLGAGHVLPFLLLAAAPGSTVLAACACSLGLRLLIALRFRGNAAWTLTQPVGVAALLALQWAALLRAARGRPTHWRGRTYPVQ